MLHESIGSIGVRDKEWELEWILFQDRFEVNGVLNMFWCSRESEIVEGGCSFECDIALVLSAFAFWEGGKTGVDKRERWW